MLWSVVGSPSRTGGPGPNSQMGGSYSLLRSQLHGMLVLIPCVFLGERQLDPPGPHAQGPLCAPLCGSVSTSEARPLPL